MGSVHSIRPANKAVVITRDCSRFKVAMTPARTPREKAVFLHFEDLEEATAYARELTILWPQLFTSIDDQTGGKV